MEIKDIKETKNHVFDRREITAIIHSEIAPSKKDVIILLSKKLSIPEDSIKLKGIYGRFGLKEFELKANVYKSEQDKDNIERKTKRGKEVKEEEEKTPEKEKTESKPKQEEKSE